MLPGSCFSLFYTEFEKLIIRKKPFNNNWNYAIEFCKILCYLNTMLGKRCSYQQFTEAVTEVCFLIKWCWWIIIAIIINFSLLQHTVNEKSRKNSENIRITYFKHYILSISNKSLFFLQYKFLLFFSISYNYQSKNTFHREVIMAFIGFF